MADSAKRVGLKKIIAATEAELMRLRTEYTALTTREHAALEDVRDDKLPMFYAVNGVRLVLHHDYDDDAEVRLVSVEDPTVYIVLDLPND